MSSDAAYTGDTWTRSAPLQKAAPGLLPAARRSAGPGSAYRQQLGHDIRHELSTILLLASLVERSQHLGPQDQARVAQIMDETRWLEQLVAGYENAAPGKAPRSAASGEQRIDLLVADVIRALRLSTRATITLEARPVTAVVDRLALWRVLRNLMCNALQAAGEDGRVEVRVLGDEAGDVVVIEIDDNGPGYEPGATSPGSLGLRIVRDLVRRLGGRLFISSGALGGCGVRLFLHHDGSG